MPGLLRYKRFQELELNEKGKLWIPIRNIIRHKRPRPKIIFLENVPRLLNSPAKSRGLNFAIILTELISMGYDVEWRVINASEYGMPQQRRRVFIMAYRTPGSTSRQISINGDGRFGAPRKTRGPITQWVLGNSGNSKWEMGPFATAFPVEGEFGGIHNLTLALKILRIQKNLLSVTPATHGGIGMVENLLRNKR